MRHALGLLALLAVSIALAGCGASASTDLSGGVVSVVQLPTQAQQVIAEIHAGGPFEYPGKDGSTFSNYEGLLRNEPKGYYREYTVDTPGASTRGTRRIIAGRDGELYYTDDHYDSFERIQE